MEDQYDVLDEHGNKTGTTKARSLIHKDGDWHKASHVWIINSNGQVLISKRSQNVSSSPGAWTMSAGGHVDAGETGLECAKRETFEELGVQFNNNQFQYLFTITFRSGNYFPGKNVNQFNDVFLIRSDKKTSDYTFDPVELAEIKFIHYKDLEKLIADKQIEMTPQYEQFQKLFSYLKENNY